MTAKSKKRIYLDYASTTPLDPRALKRMDTLLKSVYGNASSVGHEGVVAKKELELARSEVAKVLECKSDKIVFTSGGTESNNLAIFGVVNKLREKKVLLSDIHIITTTIEHSSVLKCFQALEKEGVKVDYIPVDGSGLINLEIFKTKLQPKTCFISVMCVNNEIGTIEPLFKVRQLIDESLRSIKYIHFPKPIFHTDASQAPLFLELSHIKNQVDLMTLDGHKIYGPKGVGALYIKDNTSVKSTMIGGEQERNLRPGTENIPLIAGFAEALKIAKQSRIKDSEKLLKIREITIEKIFQICLELNIKAELNGDRKNRISNNINFSFIDIDTEYLTLALDQAGIAVSTKSACVGNEGASYVVMALLGDKARASSTLRISLGRDTSVSDVDTFLKVIGSMLKKLKKD